MASVFHDIAPPMLGGGGWWVVDSLVDDNLHHYRNTLDAKLEAYAYLPEETRQGIDALAALSPTDEIDCERNCLECAHAIYPCTIWTALGLTDLEEISALPEHPDFITFLMVRQAHQHAALKLRDSLTEWLETMTLVEREDSVPIWHPVEFVQRLKEEIDRDLAEGNLNDRPVSEKIPAIPVLRRTSASDPENNPIYREAAQRIQRTWRTHVAPPQESLVRPELRRQNVMCSDDFTGGTECNCWQCIRDCSEHCWGCDEGSDWGRPVFPTADDAAY